MPLQENPNLANKQKILSVGSVPHLPTKSAPVAASLLSVMRTKSRALISVPADFVRQQSHETGRSVIDPPKLVIDDVESSLNMSQVNGLFKDVSPHDTTRIPTGRIVSPSLLKSAALNIPEHTPSPDATWSSAVGPAGTGKSGRVIERLQGDIDRLHREKQLLKVQSEEVERANEALLTQNQYLQDRNSNYEHSHETGLRQLERKERQLQDLRDELKREKANTARAEGRASEAAAQEEVWKEQASDAKTRAAHKEVEYDAIAKCRRVDNEKYQTIVDKIKRNLEGFVRQREEDISKQKKLEIIAEQQRQTIQQLEMLTQKLSTNFKAYRDEIDNAIKELRDSTRDNDVNVREKLEEMQKTTGEMRWVMNVEREVNHKVIPPFPQGDLHSKPTADPIEAPASPSRRHKLSLDITRKHGRKKTNQ